MRAELPGFQPSETRVNVIAGYRQEITINLQASARNSNYEKGIQFERQQLLPQAITISTGPGRRPEFGVRL